MRKDFVRSQYVGIFSLSLLPLVSALHPAHAAVITITDDLTTLQETATIDGGVPGDIEIDETGSIDVSSGTALILNSDNYIINGGFVGVEDVDDAIGLSIQGGYSGSYSGDGDIVLVGSLDGTRAMNKTGLLLSGGTFTGDIEVLSSGSIFTTGDDSFGVHIMSPLVGDFINNGVTGASGSDNYGVLIEAPITGAVLNAGTLTSSTVVVDVDDDPDTLDLFYTNAALGVGASISDGIYNDGLTIEERNDDIDDSDAVFGTIVSSGADQAVYISPTLNSSGPADITIGAVSGFATGESFVNLSSISATTQNTVDATVIRIEGMTSGGTDYITTLSGGLRNDHNMTVSVNEANATVLSIGPWTVIPEINNYGTIEATSISPDGTFQTVAIFSETTEAPITLTNGGLINAAVTTTDPNAIAVLDTGGMITTVFNNGVITAANTEITTDNTLERSPGISLDLRANTTGVTVHNEENTSTEALSGLIGGDILFGSGGDTLTMSSGSISGDVDLAGGNDTVNFSGGNYAGTIMFGAGGGSFTLGDGAVFQGAIDAQTSTISATVNGELELVSTDIISLSSLNIGSTAQVTIPVGPDGLTAAGFDVTGNATINSNATFIPNIETVITGSRTLDIVQAGTLTLNGGLPIIDTASAPYIYDYTFVNTGALQLQITPKSASELGISPIQLAVYAPLIEIAEIDDNLTNVLHNLQSQQELEIALDRIMPNNTNAPFYLGLSGFEGMAESALNTNHRITEDNRYNTRFWTEESGYYRDQFEDGDQRGYIGRTFRLSAGMDVATQSLDRLGLTGSVSFEGYKPDRAPTKPYNSTALWLGSYVSNSWGNFQVGAIAGFSYTFNSSKRVVDLEDDILRAEGDWNGTQWASRLQARYHIGSEKFYVMPKAAVTYFSRTEDSYEETGDQGAALSADDLTLSGVRAEGSAAIGFVLRDQATTYHTEFEFGYRQDSGSDETREYQFVGGMTPFSLDIPGADGGAATVGFSFFGQTDYTSLGLVYKGAFDGDTSDHSIRAVLRSRF